LTNAVLGFFVTGAYYQALADSLDSGLPPAGAEVTLPFILVFVSMLLFSMIAVAITRQAMGLRQGPAFAHFSLGSAELRAFGGYFGLYILLFVFIFAFALAVGGIAIVAGSALKANTAATPLYGLGTLVVVLIGIFLLLYTMVRLSFLMIPAVLSGAEFGLTRSWQLTQGNFWRIVAIGTVTLLPTILVFGLVEFAVLGPDFFKQQVVLAKDTSSGLHHMAEQMRAMQTHMPVLMGLSFVISPILYGLSFAPAAFAYGAVTGKDTTRKSV
jgi:hypothetical protein